MSYTNMFPETYDSGSNDFFAIPKEAQFPLFDEDRDLLLFDDEIYCRHQMIQDHPILGEEVQRIKAPEIQNTEIRLSEPSMYSFECTSPKINEVPLYEQYSKNFGCLIVAESGEPSFERLGMQYKEKDSKKDDFIDSNELTDEVTNDQELRKQLKHSEPKKSRFNKLSFSLDKPQSEKDGAKNRNST
jgi:hypothetical protein